MSNLNVHKRLKDERDREEINKFNQKVNAVRKKYAGDHGSHLQKGYIPYAKVKHEVMDLSVLDGKKVAKSVLEEIREVVKEVFI